MGYIMEDSRGYRGYVGSAFEWSEVRDWLDRVSKIAESRSWMAAAAGEDQQQEQLMSGARAVREIVENGGTAAVREAAWTVTAFGPQARPVQSDISKEDFMAPAVDRFSDALQICSGYIAIR